MNEALPDLRARFHFRHGLFRKERVDVPVFELDTYGCVLKSDKVFADPDAQKNPHLTDRLHRIRSVLTRKQSIRSRRSSGPGASLQKSA